MTREEEINQASGAYAFQLCAECINSEICKEMGLGCPRLRESIIAFSEGVKWADEHPKNVWHSADEEPNDKYEILVQDEFGHFWLTDYVEDISHYQNGWKECAACECIIRWAYISELLPKGGA